MPEMTRIERMDAALKGEAVDRVPISFWRHFYLQERDTELLADALLAFQREWGWDFMKVNPRAAFHTEGWGNHYRYTDDPNTGPVMAGHAVHTKKDWAKIGVLDIWRTRPLEEQLVLLELIREGLQDENVYYLHTIFSPLAIAFRLAGYTKERLAQAMEEEASELEAALEAITETYESYVKATLDAGTSGIFFAVTQMASASYVTQEQYERFGAPYDLRVLEAAKNRPGFNMIHLCADHIYFDRLASYPVDAFSWDVTLPGNPSLNEGRKRCGKLVVGGLNQKVTLLDGTPGDVEAEVEETIRATDGRGLVIAPGCTFRPATRHEMLEAAVSARDRYSGIWGLGSGVRRPEQDGQDEDGWTG